MSLKPYKEVIENTENAQSKAIKDNATIDNIVWKQMGTAKGTGKLHKGGKWLTVEVNFRLVNDLRYHTFLIIS